MSSYVTICPAAPAVSCTAGPLATPAAGVGPVRSTARTTRCVPSGSQRTASGNTPLTDTFATRAARASAVVPSHSSVPCGVALVTAKRVPSGENRSAVTCAPAGSATRATFPSATRSIASDVIAAAWWMPLVTGSMRSPASRSIGRARSATGG